MNSTIPLVDVSEKKVIQKNNSEGSSDPKIVEQELYAPREKIYTRKISGFFQRIRQVSLSVMLGMYFLFAWINIDGKQLILFDLAERKFHLFGIVFWPQDFTLLAFALIICAFGLFFVTSLYGRVWCGYSCPQTVWSFMFMWLEEFFEGSRNKRIKLDQTEWDYKKVSKKAAKHLSWMALAFATAFTFVGYFYPVRELAHDLFTLTITSGWALFWIFFFTAATYINAGWLREQVCIYMCPYARFQSVMFNENTLIVGYDKTRGEPRGKQSKTQDNSKLGSCVDCSLCVQVCPTGIDIRDGLQYECIGCALCIDACDSVMRKMDYETGLIRYASEKEFERGSKERKIDKLSIGYGVIMLVVIGLFVANLVSRPLVELSALRDRGALYYENGMGMIENNYTLKIANKLEVPVTYELSAMGDLPITISLESVNVGPGELQEIPISILAKPEDLTVSKNEIAFRASAVNQGDVRAVADSVFWGPIEH